MSDETETITVAEVSDGPAGESDLQPGTRISLPVVELLTGRGFVTGKSGSGKSNTASVIVENLLGNNFPVLIVDSDGEYYGLKETYEVLHAGADEECDIEVSPEHAQKLATLALEENVPIVLDVSGFLDESDANQLVRETARHLFAKEKKLKKPFLMLIEECHEYIPEGAGLDETGKTLIKIGKRGRKHGLGVVGISQRPADVKKDFITQCDWLVWHRLTWDNDTKVVRRILGSAYGDAIEDLDDGEAFLMTDWAESIRRVSFDRKETFDAGATPGLEDFERPDLKSVSGDLVSELESITDQQRRRESELAELRQELDEKRQQIAELERQLEEARDMSEMADTFAQALLRKAEAPYRGGDGKNPAQERLDRIAERRKAEKNGTDADSAARDDNGADVDSAARDDNAADAGGAADAVNADGAADAVDADDADATTDEDDAVNDSRDGTGEPAETPDPSPTGDAPRAAASDGGNATSEVAASDDRGAVGTTDADRAGPRPVDPTVAAGPGGVAESGGQVVTSGGTATGPADADVPTVERTELADAVSRSRFREPEELASFANGVELRDRETVVSGFVAAIESLPPVTRQMLAHYRATGRSTPTEAHVAADGSGRRSFAYARNRTLRRGGVIDHVGGGVYAYRLLPLVRSVFAAASEQELAECVAEIEGRTGLAGD